MSEKSIRLNEKQKQALDAMLAGKNIFLSGGGGTGKSFLIETFVKSTTKNVVLCAPTGVAANHIGGITVFRLLRYPFGPVLPYHKPSNNNRALMVADVVVVDEVSMVRFDQFKYLVRTIRHYEELRDHRIQLIVVGDMYQLPPVIDERNDGPALRKLFGDVGRGFPFEAKEWDQCGFTPIILTEPMRQADPEFVENLNKLRVGDTSCIDYFNTRSAKTPNDGIVLCPTRYEAETINTTKLERLSGETHTYEASVSGVYEPSMRPNSDTVKIKIGARVMALRNDRDGRYQNGSCGTVERVYWDSVTVRFDNGIVANVGYYLWENYDYRIDEDGKLKQRPIGTFSQLGVQLAYAITIHKAQGKTFDKINIRPQCFAGGQLYVGMSRGKSIEGIYIDGEIKEDHIKVNEEVAQFYAELDEKQGTGKEDSIDEKKEIA